MSFERSDQIESYARKKYSSTAANIFVELCKKRNHQAFWTSLANGFGFGSNSPNLSLPAELPELYDNFEIPSEAYGYVSFWLDFDLDFELEERMSLMQFSDFLTDACQIYCELHPDDANLAQSLLSAAKVNTEASRKAHEAWMKRNGEKNPT